MGDTGIEWTDKTWNPVTGCTKVSPGCKHCYAERIAQRFWGDRKFTDVQVHADRLEHPRKWRKPCMVFVNSMSDLFHDDVPDGFIEDVFDVMRECPQHTFQVLTKRPDRMAYTPFHEEALPNVWLGVSVENQAMADARIPHLLRCKAAVRFISAEPLLGPISLSACISIPWAGGESRGGRDYTPWLSLINLVIVGGESGHGARPMHPDWAHTLRDQCQKFRAVPVPFFFKQWGEWSPDRPAQPSLKNSCVFHEALKFPRDPAHVPFYFEESKKGMFQQWIMEHPPLKNETRMYRIGKKAAGRLLDGREWNVLPKRDQFSGKGRGCQGS